MEINDKVRTLREIKRFSQEEMAAKLGMSVNGYAKIERGKRRLDIPKLEQIAEVLGMDLADLITADTDNVYIARQNRLKQSDLKQSVVCLINKDSPSHHNYYNGAEELLQEIKTLKQQLAHQNEIMAQKQQYFDEKTAAQQREIDLLRDLVATLKLQETAKESFD